MRTRTLTFGILGLSIICLSSCSQMPLPIKNDTLDESASPQATSKHTVPSKNIGSGAVMERLTSNGTIDIGAADAPLALTLFTNESCEYCHEYFQNLLPRLQKDFIDTGFVHVEIVILPLQKYPNSALEAAALLCAESQKKGLPLHDALFAGPHDRASIIAKIRILKLDEKAFTTCLDSEDAKTSIQNQQSKISSQKITLIPTLTSSSQTLTGLPQYPELRGWIESQL